MKKSVLLLSALISVPLYAAEKSTTTSTAKNVKPLGKEQWQTAYISPGTGPTKKIYALYEDTIKEWDFNGNCTASYPCIEHNTVGASDEAIYLKRSTHKNLFQRFSLKDGSTQWINIPNPYKALSSCAGLIVKDENSVIFVNNDGSTQKISASIPQAQYKRIAYLDSGELIFWNDTDLDHLNRQTDQVEPLLESGRGALDRILVNKTLDDILRRKTSNNQLIGVCKTHDEMILFLINDESTTDFVSLRNEIGAHDLKNDRLMILDTKYCLKIFDINTGQELYSGIGEVQGSGCTRLSDDGTIIYSVGNKPIPQLMTIDTREK